jgi:ribonuclease D
MRRLMAEQVAQSIAVETPEALAEAARGWAAAPALAVDTEFVRERTFYHRLGLVQVADGGAAYLVDPLAVGELAPLAEVFRGSGVKVLHSASEDIEVFYHALGALPEPLFDTQVGAALAGLGTSLGYARLVAEVLGVELFKEETRTDWLARPLSAAQRAYAAEDVAYLLPLYERLRGRLEELGRLGWAFEDSAALLDTARFEEEPERAYLRVKGAGRLDRRQLAVLQALAAWREREARRRDLPRRFVLKEDLLLALATRRPTTARELERLPSLDRRQAARDAGVWLELVREAMARPGEELPPSVTRLPFSPAVKALAGRLRAVAAERAAELGLAPEVLAPRRTLDALLASALENPAPRLPRELAGWRRAVVGEALLAEASAAAPSLPRLTS